MRNKPDLKPHHYRIKINGRLEERWSDWFENLEFTHDDDGTTTLSGPLADPTALRSVLNHINDLGFALLSVQTVDPKSNRTET